MYEITEEELADGLSDAQSFLIYITQSHESRDVFSIAGNDLLTNGMVICSLN